MLHAFLEAFQSLVHGIQHLFSKIPALLDVGLMQAEHCITATVVEPQLLLKRTGLHQVKVVLQAMAVD